MALICGDWSINLTLCVALICGDWSINLTLCVALICGDWSINLTLCVTLICGDWSISFKAGFVSSVLLCVKPLLGKKPCLTLQKQHLVAKNEFAFSFRPTWKSKFSQVCARNKWASKMLMLHFDVSLKRLGFVFKKRSRLFLLRDNNFINGALSDLKLCRMFSFTCYTLHERSFKTNP